MGKRTKIFLNRILYCLITIGFGFLQAQPYNELGIPSIKNYSPKEYKGHPQIFGVAQDTNGIVYFSGNGIIEYDGESWRKLPPLGVVTWSVVLGNDKRIYIGGTDDFGYLKVNELGQQEFVSLLSLLPKNQRNFGQLRQATVMEDAIYFSSRENGYLIRYNYIQKKIKVWKKEGTIAILGTAYNNLYLLVSEIGLCKLVGDEIKSLAEESEFANSSLVSALPYKANQLLICTRDKGLFHYQNGKVIPFPTEADELLQTRTYFAKTLPDSTFLFSIIGQGIIVLDETGKWIQHLTKSKGLANDIVLTAHIDNSRELWLGTFTGLSKVNLLSPTSKFSVDENGIPISMNDIIRFGDYLYGASSNINGLLYLDKKGATFRNIKNAPSGQAFSVSKIKCNLYGTGDGGIFKIEEIRAKPIYRGKDNEFIPFGIHQSQLDSNRILLGLSDGLMSIYKKNNSWKFERKREDIPNNLDIRHFLEYPAGSLWLGTQNQGTWLVEYENSNFDTHNSIKVRNFEKGIHNLDLGYTYVYLIDNKVTITGAGGIYTYEEKNDQLILDSRFPMPIPNKDIQSILLTKAKAGDVYAHFSKFDESMLLGKYKKQNDNTYAFETSNLQQIPTEDLLNVAKLYLDDDEILWIADQNGLIRFDTKKKSLPLQFLSQKSGKFT